MLSAELRMDEDERLSGKWAMFPQVLWEDTFQWAD